MTFKILLWQILSLFFSGKPDSIRHLPEKYIFIEAFDYQNWNLSHQTIAKEARAETSTLQPG